MSTHNLTERGEIGASTGPVAPTDLHIDGLPEGERPRERFESIGAGGVSQRELLAILLRTGTDARGVLGLADDLLARFGGLAGLLAAPLEDLRAVRGIGRVKSIELKAALELGKRAALASPEHKPQIKTPADAAQLLMPDMAVLEQEEVHTLLLDTRNRVLARVMIYRGSLNAASMRVGELFKQAIRANAAGLIVAHNHPSGDPLPSNDDVAVTKALIQAGKLLEIDVLDHLVIGRSRFTSLKERRLGFD
jgi:DNA repair protein RadC